LKSEQIIIDGLVIELIRKPIKHLYLRISPDNGRIVVSAPNKMPLHTIEQFLTSKNQWLQSRASQSRQTATAEQSDHMVYLGKKYAIIPHSGKSVLLFMSEQFYGKLPLSQASIKQWYRTQLELLAAPMIQHWQAVIGVTVKEWGIKAMKSRWGSCNVAAHRIWLNLHLIKYPLPCLEYVIVHELVHLLEASHNRRFYQFMERFLPDWKERSHRLRELPIDAVEENISA